MIMVMMIIRTGGGGGGGCDTATDATIMIQTIIVKAIQKSISVPLSVKPTLN